MPSGIYLHRKLTDQEKKKRSEATKKQWSSGKRTGGWKVSKAGRKNMSLARSGIKYTAERNLKMSKDRLGNGNPNWLGGTSYSYIKKHPPRPKPDKCESCGKEGKICFDHDHTTGKFRGWLCKGCNVALGFMKEDYEALILLSEYIKKMEKKYNVKVVEKITKK